MVLGALAAIAAVWLFWSASRRPLVSEGVKRGAWGFLCVCLGLTFATAPGPAPTWITNAMLGSLTLCIFGLGAAVIFDRIEKGNAYRADTADGVPAMRAHWPSGLIAAA